MCRGIMRFLLLKFDRFAANLYWFAVSVFLLIVLAWLSWQSLTLSDFHYSFWYDWLEIKQHIVLYGPQNRHYLGLELLTTPQHVALFGQIVAAIHQHGQGLAEITFYNGAMLQPLLTPAEITHLQDVANLIDVATAVAYGSMFFLIVLMGCPRLLKRSYPHFYFKAVCRFYLITLFTLGLFLILIGPKAVFYWCHTLVFPDGHQWFFYYQDSLMTTLMKAPDLFGAIAIALVFYVMVIGGLFVLLIKGVMKINSNI